MLPVERNTEFSSWNTMMMTTNPARTGRMPLSPARTRLPQALMYSPSDSATTSELAAVEGLGGGAGESSSLGSTTPAGVDGGGVEVMPVSLPVRAVRLTRPGAGPIGRPCLW